MIDRGMLWIAALEDLGSRCSVDTTLDIEYVQRRIAAEGETFLTTTLPAYGKDFERSLEDLTVSRTMFTGFARRSRLILQDDDGRVPARGGLPQFLQNFTSIVFDDAYDVTRNELMHLRQMVRTHNSRLGGMSSDSIFIEDLLPPIARPTSGCSEEEVLRMADAIAAVRQLCLMFSKEKSICSDHLVDLAVAEFVATDEELIDPFSTEE